MDRSHQQSRQSNRELENRTEQASIHSPENSSEKGLSRKLIEKQELSLQPLIEMRDKINFAWNIVSYSDEVLAAYGQKREDLERVFSETFQRIETNIQTLREANPMAKVAKVAKAIRRGHKERQNIKQEIFCDLNSLILIQRDLNQYKKQLDKGLSQAFIEKQKLSLQPLIEMRHKVQDAWIDVAYSDEVLAAYGQTKDGLSRVVKEKFREIDTKIRTLSEADPMAKVAKAIRRGHKERQNIKQEIFCDLNSLILIQRDLDKQKPIQEVNEIRIGENVSEKKILVLFTGGTIGSVKIPGGKIVQPSEAIKAGIDAKPLLIETYKERYNGSNIRFVNESIMETLSENITPERMNHLITKLKEIKFEEYDGIVLTHGSDTLGHTANYLSMLLASIKVPMILVSSNYIVTDKRANGIENLKGAVDFISSVNLPGVYVTDNAISKEKIKVIYGSRVTQCKPITDDYGSTSIGGDGQENMSPLGVIEGNKFKILDKELFSKIRERSEKERSEKERSEDEGENLLDHIESLDAKILWIQPHFGLNYDSFNLEGVTAVLHGAYHGGSACTDGKSENLLKFAERCKAERIDLYLGPIYGDADRDVYGSTAEFCESGGMTIMNLSPESALAKLFIAYSLYKDDEEKRKAFIYKNVNQEFVLPATTLKRESGDHTSP